MAFSCSMERKAFMSINLSNFEEQTRSAVKQFWLSRSNALLMSKESDHGERGSVTSDKNMDGFLDIIRAIVSNNGLSDFDLHMSRSLYLTLPGFFRPTKRWDVLVVHQNILVAAIEVKSQVGSFGNNFNNRCEEVLGSATDLWTTFREGAFGQSPRPFVGYLMLLEDSEGSRNAVNDRSHHFQIFPEFKNASYMKRYELLCEKLVRERLYDAATILVSPRSALEDGAYREMSQLTGMRQFTASLASHVATAAALS